MNKKIIPCVAFILLKDNKILVEKRKSTKRVDPGKLCIPSGGILENESKEDAMIREVKEEFSIVAKDYQYVGTLLYTNKEVDFLIDYFLIKSWSGKIKMLEASKLFWIHVDDYKKINVWCDKLIIQALKKAKIL